MFLRRSSLSITIIVAVCAVLFFIGLGKRGFWSPDETRYVAVSKHILDSGDWITLRRNGELYPQKPPVFFWLISIFGLLFGKLSEFSARLASALPGVGGVILTYLIAAKVVNKRVALFSGLILATSLGYLGACQYLILDPLFTFFVIAAIYLFYLGATNQRLRFITYVLAFGSMALGTLTKGPVGFILPLLVIIIYFISEKKGRLLATWPIFIGLLVFISIISAWLIPACINGGEAYTKELLLNQIFGRFFKAFDHGEPFYFYFIRFPLEFLPWSIFIPAAAVYLIRNRAKERSVKLIFIWFSVIFLFFTVSSSKNDLYILPAYPAAAMAIACYLESKTDRKWRYSVYLTVVFMIILNIILNFAVLPRFDIFKSPKYLAQKIIKHLNPKDDLVTFKTNPAYWLYYCKRSRIKEISDYDELNRYLKSRKRVFCIIEKGNFDTFKNKYKTKVTILEGAPYGRKKIFALISNMDKAI